MVALPARGAAGMAAGAEGSAACVRPAGQGRAASAEAEGLLQAVCAAQWAVVQVCCCGDIWLFALPYEQ